MNNPHPSCPKCKSNSQVWFNQISGKLVCHRAGCHISVDSSPHIHCHQCGKLIPVEKTHNGVSECWIGHCCGFGQDSQIGSEVYL